MAEAKYRRFKLLPPCSSSKPFPSGEGLGGVRGIEVLFAPIAAMFNYNELLVEAIAALFEAIEPMF